MSTTTVDSTPTCKPFGSYRIPLDTDRVRCTRQSVLAASLVGLDRQAGWEAAIAVTELVKNALKFAERGILELRIIEGVKRGLEVMVNDEGSGIVDIEQEDSEGLRAVRHLMDEMQIENVLGGGTRIVARKWCR